MGLMKSVKKSFRVSKNNPIDKKGDDPAEVSPKKSPPPSPGKPPSPPAKAPPAEKPVSTQEGRIALPKGKVGIKFAGSPPEITAVNHDSPLAGQVEVGQVVESIVIPGQEPHAGLNSPTASKILKESAGLDGRAMVLKSKDPSGEEDIKGPEVMESKEPMNPIPESKEEDSVPAAASASTESEEDDPNEQEGSKEEDEKESVAAEDEDVDDEKREAPAEKKEEESHEEDDKPNVEEEEADKESVKADEDDRYTSHEDEEEKKVDDASENAREVEETKQRKETEQRTEKETQVSSDRGATAAEDDDDEKVSSTPTLCGIFCG
eukprot:CAMPEP_0197441742 /NCGR_PEP_ID=MMETSP1175-20131217/7938_1 /TAXON_ID=1003142 /ORGANISM="Triceratium dubium, Strain CCMP147" /LENGTH=320 /DNA_ID=CAMNT_0042972071 /DNA_START=220 /DNA_END=1182 /DNA_ORIENTATION=+